MTETPASSKVLGIIFSLDPFLIKLSRYISAILGINIASAIPSTKITPFENSNVDFVTSNHLFINFSLSSSSPHLFKDVIFMLLSFKILILIIFFIGVAAAIVVE